METKPRYQLVDALAEQAVGLADPCVMLVENDPAFSVLFAQKAECVENTGDAEGTLGTRLRLDWVFQLRLTDNSVKVFRTFDAVDVYYREQLWLAEVSGTGQIFSSPSEDPYRIIFLEHNQYAIMRSEAYHGRSDKIFQFCRDQFGMLPGFFCADPECLMSPARYACAHKEIDGMSVGF